MKKKQRPLSFSLCEENIAYVEQEHDIKHRNRSHWMDDLITHLRLKKEASTPVKAPKANRKKIEYPSNLDDQFLLLWDTKGKKGAKQKAYDKYRSLMANNTDEVCEQATMIMITDINKNKGECGYPEIHLTTYLNQARWED